jgi:hypothetical protein
MSGEIGGIPVGPISASARCSSKSELQPKLGPPGWTRTSDLTPSEGGALVPLSYGRKLLEVAYRRSLARRLTRLGDLLSAPLLRINSARHHSVAPYHRSTALALERVARFELAPQRWQRCTLPTELYLQTLTGLSIR